MSAPKRRYVICAPPYSGSAGVRALYLLRDTLEARGFDARIFKYGRKGCPFVPKRCFVTEIDDAMREEGVVVYSESVWGNPLGFRRVVRWVLNYPGLMGGDRTYARGEYVVSWVPQYLDCEHELRLDLLDRSVFYNDGRVKDTDAVFIHKGGEVRRTPELAHLPVITISNPSSRRELAELLRRCRTLYSHDKNSLLLEEARLCGAKIAVVTESGFEDLRRIAEDFNPGKLEPQLARFTADTQEWTGPVCDRKDEPDHRGLRIVDLLGYVAFACLIKLKVPGNWSRSWLYFMQRVYLRPR